MSYNSNHAETNWVHFGGQLVDVNTASVSYTAVPFQGRLRAAWACISAAVTTLDTTVTIQKKVGAATAQTCGTIVLAATGSAIGQTVQATITGTEDACTFQAGDTLIFDSDGAGSVTSIANFHAVFKGM